jgi:hypothetical protein
VVRELWPVEAEGDEQPADQPKPRPQLDERLLKLDAELQPAEHTRVDRYLTARGITIRSPRRIAYHRSLWHPWTRTSWPAMICVLQDVHGHPVAVHQTYLTHAEPVRKAPVEPLRAMLGPLKGHAVHLSPAAETLLLAEGVETTLSAMQWLGLPGWSAISAGNLPHVELPEIVREVVIAADSDQSGVAAATQAARTFRRAGRTVRVVKPSGCGDFNDLLLRRQ